MALTRNGNTLYIPSGETNTDYVPTNNTTLIVSYILLSCEATHGTLTLYNGGGSVLKLHLHGENAAATERYDFTRDPIIFPNGIRATTVDCVATIVFRQAGA